MIIVTLAFYKIDNWEADKGDHVEFMFDSVSLKTWSFSSYQSYEQTLCGTPGVPDYPNIKIRMNVPHMGSSITMKVISHLDQDSEDESFGIRDINMAFVNMPNPEASLCGISNYYLPDRICNCPLATQYKDPMTGSCVACTSPCITCDRSGPYGCLACSAMYFIDDISGCSTCRSPCGTCIGTSFNCSTCAAGAYFVANKTCVLSCDPPLFTTSDGTNDFCESPCNTSDFVYSDQSCFPTCNQLFQRENVGIFKICKYPCFGGLLLHYNGSCLSSCNLPFRLRTDGSYQVCDYACLTTEYLYPNGTCLPKCGFPFKPILKGRKRFCELFCNDSLYFLYNNQSCVPSCPDFFYSQENPKVCYECMDSLCQRCSGQFGEICEQCLEGTILDLDGTCKICNSMEIEYIKVIGTTGHQYKLQLFPGSCDLHSEIITNNLKGVNNTEKAFPFYSIKTKKILQNSYIINIFFEESVLEQADLDLTLHHLNGTAIIPKTIVPTSRMQQLAEYASIAQTAMTSITATSMGGAIALGATAVLWPMINFQQFVGYFIYINIDYPRQVDLFLSLFTFPTFSFIPNPIAPITDDLKEKVVVSSDFDLAETHEAPRKFRKYEETSFFAENGASTLLSNLGFLFVLGITNLLMKYYRRKQLPFIKQLHYKLKWNFIFRGFLESGIPLSLATFLQLRKLSFENYYTMICGGLTILSFFYLIVMSFFIIQAVIKKSEDDLKHKHFQSVYGTLYEGITTQSKLGKYYHIVILLRGILLVFLVSFLELSPLLQISPLILVNLGLVYILLKEAIFDDYKLNAINRAKEILIILVESCMILMHLFPNREEVYQILGWLTIAFLGVIVLVELIYMIAIQIFSLKPVIARIKIMYHHLFSKYIRHGRAKRPARDLKITKPIRITQKITQNIK